MIYYLTISYVRSKLNPYDKESLPEVWLFDQFCLTVDIGLILSVSVVIGLILICINPITTLTEYSKLKSFSAIPELVWVEYLVYQLVVCI